MLKSMLIIVILFFNSFNIMCQELDNKYLLSIIYLKSNTEINKEIKAFFKKDIPKNVKNVPFHVSDEIIFLDIETFKDSLLEFYDNIDTIILESQRAFEEHKTYRLEILKSLLPVSADDLILYFSKPVGNILVAELTNFDMSANSGIKFGKGFRILFLFNEMGNIEKVYTKTFIYN